MLAALAGFALCFAILASGWMARLMGWQRVLVRSSPYEPSAEAFAHYLAEVAVHLDEKPEPLVMTLDGGGSAHELDFLPDGRMAVSVEGAGRHVFSLRRRWLPDHEVPLRFGEGGSSITLYATPDRGSRFRVRRSLELSEKRLLLAAGLFAFVLFFAVVAVSSAAFMFSAGMALGALAQRILHSVRRHLDGVPPSISRFGRRSGQVALVFLLLIAVLACLVAMNADVFFSVTRKNQLENAGDAAALAAARSQGLILNEIGRLNLERVEAMLEGDPERAASALERQDELRLSGPVEGALVAAQDAAKENRVYVDPGMTKLLESRSAAIRSYFDALDDEKRLRADVYASALERAIFSTGGIAAGPDNMDLFDFNPESHMLYSKEFYDAILGRNWCWFHFNAPDLLESYRNHSDWAPLPDSDGMDAVANSEVFSLGVVMRNADIVAAVGADELAHQLHECGLAMHWTGPMLATNETLRSEENLWCFYDSRMWRGWEEACRLSEFMVGSVKGEYDVLGCAAVTRVIAAVEPSMPGESAKTVVWTAAAKPFGCVRMADGGLLPCTALGGFVLPSFTAARLIPVDAAFAGGFDTADAPWMEHIFLHLPGYLERGRALRDCRWCEALRTWESDGFREGGRLWLALYSHTCVRPLYGGDERSGGRRHGH